MSTTQEIRAEAQVLREQYREVLLTAAQKAASGILEQLPVEGERITAIRAANIRWAMLLAGFTHRENQELMSKLNAIAENKGVYPTTEEEVVTLIETACIGSDFHEDTKRATMYLLKEKWGWRLSHPLLNAHERMVFSIGKRLQAILQENAENKDALVATIATATGVQEVMVYRVATGGTKVPGVILQKMDRAIRRVEETLSHE
jgi:hypothetical protein